MKTIRTLFAVALLSGCAMGPNYQRASVEIPESYKASTGTPANEVGQWKVADPRDTIAKGAWWEIYGDPVLNDLETRATRENQSLKAAAARVEQARAIARISRADLFPNLNLSPSQTWGRDSENTRVGVPGATFSSTRLPLDLSYEIDIWGRVRRAFEASRDEALASVSDYETIFLTLKADVAQNYFALRSLDQERALLRRTIELRQEALHLVDSRFKNGVANDLDLAQAQTEVATAQADLTGLDKRRIERENALAVLVGLPPANFSVAENTRELQIPVIPGGLPSEILERRPDIASAERTMAAQNARIGVAKAAFFPVVRLTGNMGLESGDITQLFNWSSRAWSMGPSISLPIFEAGRNMANLSRAKSGYEESVANYRQQVLVAFQEVEDGLSGLRLLTQQIDQQTTAVRASQRTADLSGKRYQAGLSNYLEVVDANRSVLNNQRLVTQINGQRLALSVQLIKALGGGWQESPLKVATN
jgi:multidrug efflux system outer membrane protein